MFARLRGRLTFANAVSSIALFVALGGTSYAAVTLSSNSVRSKHIKDGQVKRVDIAKNAVNADKVADGTLLAKDFKPGQFVAGAPGPAGSQGAQGPKGDKGATGDPGPLLATLPSGKTLRGIYSYAGHQTTGYSPTYAISYQFQLASAANENVIAVNGASTANCPGTVSDPQAASGHVCVYEARNDSNSDLSATNQSGYGGFGTVLFAAIPDDTDYELDGTWAVTAP
jgi:hypothetical protein